MAKEQSEPGCATCYLCQYENSKYDLCKEENDLICTRPLGHEGSHAACGPDDNPAQHPIKEWNA